MISQKSKDESQCITRHLLIDSWFDNYLGIVVLIKVVDGSISLKIKLKYYQIKRVYC